jgi:hypothetical protein
VDGAGGVHQGSFEVAMRLAHAANHIVVATESVARAILLCGFLLVLYYAADRAPPFAVLSVEPAEARAGDYITIKAHVRRDADRRCDAEYSRYLFDATGARFDMGRSITSAEMISSLERKSPGGLTISFHVPPSAAVGPALLQTVLDYKCNRLHRLMPITVTTDMPFTVLP